MFMRSPLLLIASLGVLAGCSSQVGPAEEAPASSAAAVIVVSRSAGPGDLVRDDTIVARFVRVRQGAPLDDAALRLAGVANDLPSVGTCRSTVDDRSTVTSAGREIDLLDVGPVSVDSNAMLGKSTILLPRQMPDPTGIVSGVFYSARSADAFAPATRLSLRASGGKELPEGFVVAVNAPRDLGDVRAQNGSGGLDVSWDADSDADLRDVVTMDVLDRTNRVITRCSAFDGGHFLVPTESLGAVEEGQIVVHRVHHEGFTAKGIAPGEVRFDLARVVTFRR